MSARYAYSYNREDYTGSYNSPEEALTEAIRNTEGLTSPPTEVFVGRIVSAEPQANDHAERVIEAMNRRAHVDFGEAASKYLRKVGRKQVQELDGMLEATILQWLGKNNLMPNFTRVDQVREYPVPLPRTMASPRPSDGGGAGVREVGELGVSEQPELT